MKKSLLALLLALVMCMSLFCTACSSGDEEDDSNILKTEDEITPMTITLYAPTEGTTTQEQVEIVQAAFNDITQAKFNTNVILKLIPEDKYNEVINTNLVALRKERADKAAAEFNGETATEEENTELEAGSYPEATENQMDIFMVQSFESFYELSYGVDGESDLAPIDTQLAETAKLLSSYVYPYLLRSAKYDGETFGVFNNTIFAGEDGGYQYLLLNKELVDKYEYDPELMSDLSSISMFLEEVKKNEPEVVPFLGDIEAPVVYWNDQKSIIGAYVGKDFTSSGTINATSYTPDYLDPANLFNNKSYQEWITLYNTLNRQEIFVDKTEENATAKFAATIINGDVTMSPTYADIYGNYKEDQFGFKYVTIDGVDYYASVYRRPIADNNNVFKAGYVVSASAADPTRCMEIITYLNTDAQLSNLFMYGVKDIHYSINEETGLVHKLTDTYAMDIQNIGNMYLLTPSDDMSAYWQFMSANSWQNAKNTNREAVMSPFLGFYYNPEKPVAAEEGEENAPKLEIEVTFAEAMAEITKLSPAWFERIENYVPTEEMDMQMFIRSLLLEMNDNDYVKAVTSADANYYYTRSPYRTWYQKHYNVTINQG